MSNNLISPTRGRARGAAQRVIGIAALVIAVPLGAGALFTTATVGTTTTTASTVTRTPAPSTSTITTTSEDVNFVVPRLNATGKANRRAAELDRQGCSELADGSNEARYRCLERSPYFDVPPRKTTTHTRTSRSRVSQSPTTTVLYSEKPHKAGKALVTVLGGGAAIAAVMGLLLIIGSRIKPTASPKHAASWQATQGANTWQPHNESTAQFGAPVPVPAQPQPSQWAPPPAQPENAADYPAYAVNSEGDVTPPPPFDPFTAAEAQGAADPFAEPFTATEPHDAPQQESANRPPTAGGDLGALF